MLGEGQLPEGGSIQWERIPSPQEYKMIVFWEHSLDNEIKLLVANNATGSQTIARFNEFVSDAIILEDSLRIHKAAKDKEKMSMGQGSGRPSKYRLVYTLPTGPEIIEQSVESEPDVVIVEPDSAPALPYSDKPQGKPRVEGTVTSFQNFVFPDFFRQATEGQYYASSSDQACRGTGGNIVCGCFSLYAWFKLHNLEEVLQQKKGKEKDLKKKFSHKALVGEWTSDNSSEASSYSSDDDEVADLAMTKTTLPRALPPPPMCLMATSQLGESEDESSYNSDDEELACAELWSMLEQAHDIAAKKSKMLDVVRKEYKLDKDRVGDLESELKDLVTSHEALNNSYDKLKGDHVEPFILEE
ncbi:hypothetical protein PR202_gb13018 [Eleusine coracana subsp. coracana]|uniref:Uncharacterized protein n=1 Tax=Eleusine coracana subsp. coracana TaxID=191504 RepID=A0AAV5ERS5_ELECO|nr:hypothetical protein PR202_gb13018 [Eleusine coracana subsp. coracana]